MVEPGMLGIEVVDGIVVDVGIQQHLQQQWMQIKQQTMEKNKD